MLELVNLVSLCYMHFDVAAIIDTTQKRLAEYYKHPCVIYANPQIS